MQKGARQSLRCRSSLLIAESEAKMTEQIIDAELASGKEGPVRPRDLLQAVGRRIVRERKRRGWSQGDLARRLGIKRERMGNWERGENAPRLEELALLAEALRISLDELVLGKRRGRRLTEDELRRGERLLAGLVELLGAAPGAPADGEESRERPFRGHEGPEVPGR
jgi:transcriptional regulator with XRE-family HTH domain